MAARLRSFWQWVRGGHFQIKDRTGDVTSLAPNQLQTMIQEAMMEQALLGAPIRLIVLKDRKPGCSTWIQGLNYFLAKYTDHWHSQLVAHSKDDTRRIFEIGRRSASLDESAPHPSTLSKLEMEFEHDSYSDARTAGGEFVSSGSTLNALHCSELAKWPGDQRGVTAQLTSLLNAVPDVPESIVVIESTAEAGDVEFKERWEQSEAGNTPYYPVFHPWVKNRMKRSKVRGSGLGELDENEEKLRLRFPDLEDEQLQWRRDKIAGDCKGDRIIFNQEHPSTPEEAFQVATGKIFPMLDKETHERNITDDQRITGGYEVYRSLDWGGADPFVCLWAAYKPEPVAQRRGFTIDVTACPNTWRELTSYHYDANGRPKDRNNHTCDALRYMVMQFQLLAGHLHVFREMYIPHSAQMMLTDLDHANEIQKIDAGTPISGTTADPSQPKTINLLNGVGMGITPYERVSRVMDIKDGIAHLRALMLATHPLIPILDPVPPKTRWLRTIEESDMEFGVTDTELLISLNRNERSVNDWFMD